MDITVIITKVREIMEEWFALKENVPTKTSDLINDNDFATTTNIPTKTSDLINDNDFATVANIPTKTSDLINDNDFITNSDISEKENISNKVTSLSSASTDIQYPSAKCVFNNFAAKEEVIEKINYGNVDTSQGMRGHIAAFYLFDYLYYGIKIDLEIAYGGDVNYNQLYAHFGDIFTYDDGVIDTNSLTITKPSNVNVSLYSMGSDGYGITISHTGTVPSSGIAKVMIYKVVPLFYNF